MADGRRMTSPINGRQGGRPTARLDKPTRDLVRQMALEGHGHEWISLYLGAPLVDVIKIIHASRAWVKVRREGAKVWKVATQDLDVLDLISERSGVNNVGEVVQHLKRGYVKADQTLIL